MIGPQCVPCCSPDVSPRTSISRYRFVNVARRHESGNYQIHAAHPLITDDLIECKYPNSMNYTRANFRTCINCLICGHALACFENVNRVRNAFECVQEWRQTAFANLISNDLDGQTILINLSYCIRKRQVQRTRYTTRKCSCLPV